MDRVTRDLSAKKVTTNFFLFPHVIWIFIKVFVQQNCLKSDPQLRLIAKPSVECEKFIEPHENNHKSRLNAIIYCAISFSFPFLGKIYFCFIVLWASKRQNIARKRSIKFEIRLKFEVFKPHQVLRSERSLTTSQFVNSFPFKGLFCFDTARRWFTTLQSDLKVPREHQQKVRRDEDNR